MTAVLAPESREPDIGSRDSVHVSICIPPSFTAIPWGELVLGKFLGAGSFASVYVAERDERPVAVKKLKLPPGVTSSTAQLQYFVKSFVEEVTTISRIAHPNCVRFLGACVDFPNLALVTEYMEGGDLHHYIYERELSHKQRIELIYDVAKGLAYLHARKLVHRDLKPANILLDAEGRCKIADFGLTAVAEVGSAVYAGTPLYMAPEVMLSEQNTAASDVWSFAVVAWEVLSVKKPYTGRDRTQNFFESPGAISTEWPSQLDALLTRCFRAKPERRPAMTAVLSSLIGGTMRAVRFIDALQARNTYLIVQEMMNNASSIHQKLADGTGVLHVAAELGSKDMAERAVERGAIGDEPDARGRTAIDIAREKGLTKLVQVLEGSVSTRRRGQASGLAGLLVQSLKTPSSKDGGAPFEAQSLVASSNASVVAVAGDNGSVAGDSTDGGSSEFGGTAVGQTTQSAGQNSDPTSSAKNSLTDIPRPVNDAVGAGAPGVNANATPASEPTQADIESRWRGGNVTRTSDEERRSDDVRPVVNLSNASPNLGIRRAAANVREEGQPPPKSPLAIQIPATRPLRGENNNNNSVASSASGAGGLGEEATIASTYVAGSTVTSNATVTTPGPVLKATGGISFLPGTPLGGESTLCSLAVVRGSEADTSTPTTARSLEFVIPAEVLNTIQPGDMIPMGRIYNEITTMPTRSRYGEYLLSEVMFKRYTFLASGGLKTPLSTSSAGAVSQRDFNDGGSSGSGGGGGGASTGTSSRVVPPSENEEILVTQQGVSDLILQRILATVNCVSHWGLQATLGACLELPYHVTVVKERMAENLQHALAKNTVTTQQEWLHYLLQAARGLQHLHRIGLTHGNIKPANVMISFDGVGKLGDFYIHAIETRPGDIYCGDLLYAAPETIQREANTAASDVFSFGLLIYEVIKRQPAFKIRADPTVLPDLTALGAAETLVTRCLSLDPTQRPLAAELVAGLRSLVGDHVGRSKEDEELRVIMSEAGQVMANMERQANDPEAIIHGLARPFFEHPEWNKKTLKSMGHAISFALYNHTENVWIARACTKILDIWTSKSVHTCLYVRDQALSEIAALALKYHAKDLEVARHSCRMVLNMCSEEKCRGFLRGGRYLEHVRAASKAHPDHEEIQELTAQVMNALGKDTHKGVYHPHSMKLAASTRATWECDGCRQGYMSGDSTTARYRCVVGCNFDLCYECFVLSTHVKLGKLTEDKEPEANDPSTATPTPT